MTLRSLTSPDQEELDTGAEAMIAAVARGVDAAEEIESASPEAAPTQPVQRARSAQPAAPGAAEAGEPEAGAESASDEALPKAAQASSAMPDPWEDVAEPERGMSYSVDTEVSRLLEALSVPSDEEGMKTKVIVNRGNAAELLEFE
jgi:hypothetical protein